MANRIFAFVGPHASGKTTIITQLMSMGIPCIKTYTTKSINEKDPHSSIYQSISRDDFLRQDFIVKVSYKGHYYGILKRDVLQALENNRLTLMVLDVNGIKQINKLIKQNIYTIYLMADYVVLVDRMLRNGLRNDEIKYHLEYAEANNEFEAQNLILEKIEQKYKGVAKAVADSREHHNLHGPFDSAEEAVASMLKEG